MARRRKIIAGNWKMNGRLTSGLNLAIKIMQLAESSKPLSCDIVICPPATLVWPVAEALLGSPVFVGGQDCHFENQGAHTGDISAGMLSDLDCRYVIVGHSERRIEHKETNQIIAKKVAAAQQAGLTAILCVGESKEQRASGDTIQVISKQIQESLSSNCHMDQLIVAYEPVWAIGTGEIPTVFEITKVNSAIRDTLGTVGKSVRVLYGGSVTPDNAAKILCEEEIDGALVGGASLDAANFWKIVEVVS